MKISRIVVGVDGSAASRHALQWAAEEAGRRGATVVAVMAWHYPAVAYVPMSTGGLVPSDAMQASTEIALAAIVGEVLGDAPGVEIELVAVWSNPSHALLDQVGPETMLVIGRRGRSMFREILFGSTARSTIHHATCPVAVLQAA